MFSGGLGSFFAAKRVIDLYGPQDVILLFSDTLIEDEDLYRFLDDAEKYFGIPITRIAEGRDPWQVFFDSNMLGSYRMDPCSKMLKRRFLKRWVKKNHHHKNCILYYGIDWTEEHRLKTIQQRMGKYECQAPLCWPPFETKSDLKSELAVIGIPIPRLYNLGYSHNNCFSGDTRFITKKGTIAFKDHVGEEVEVLGFSGAWQKAVVKSFGIQQIVELVLTKNGRTKTIHTTADHMWLRRQSERASSFVVSKTEDLLPGHKLQNMYVSRTTTMYSPVGVAAGFTFGDGTRGEVGPGRAYFCGEKDKVMLQFFPWEQKTRPDGVIIVDHLPRTWKDLPDLSESGQYLRGWLMGLIAADGTVGKTVSIATASLETAQHIRDVATVIGLGTHAILTESRLGFGEEKSDLYTVGFVISTLDEGLFLMPHHLEKFKTFKRTNAPVEWRVQSVEYTDRFEEVYCVTADKGRFTLEDHIYTSNCGGFCVKSGQAQFALLLKHFPERYKYHEDMEQKFREKTGKDVAIMRKMTNYERKPMTMKQFREWIEAGKSYDVHEFGGCGCA